MANYTSEQREEHKERVRSILARYGDLPVTRIQKVLKSSKTNPLSLSTDYLYVLRKDITKERIKGIRTAAVDYLFAEWRDEQQQLKAILWDIIGNRKVSPFNKITAINSVNKMSGEFLEKMIASNLISDDDMNQKFKEDINLSELDEYTTAEQFDERESEIFAEIKQLADKCEGENSSEDKGIESLTDEKVLYGEFTVQDETSINQTIY